MANANPNEVNFSLIQQQEQRRAIVQKMRGKLAGRSPSDPPAAEKKRASSHGLASAWGWRIAFAAVVLAAAMAWLPRNAGIGPAASPAKAKPALVLTAPSEKFGINDQALFWTYALYDFDRLKVSYGVPKHVIIDAELAAGKLRVLRPKVDARTRFIIDGYMTNDRRKS
ncbi:MAG: hypothetical protein M3Y08_12600 [Fibrobacterota bacterium]|nr:hypothetical protein [Fibrobacterota bacterium]